MQPGQKVAHYEILGTAGEGGMGVVYRARDTKLGRGVALKFLPPDAGRDERVKQRFVQEARAASSLDHPNICTIHDIAETDDERLFIVMAYYEGRTLKDRLRDERFPVERCLGIGRQLAAALARAHAAGIVHRDLKPANVMILDGDEVKLLDFGVAKLTTDEDVTATRGTVGTIAYMSPEQLHGSDVDARTDVWALGAVLHEMLAGTRPFEGETSATVITAILQQAPPELTSLRSDVPEDLASLVRRCLSKDRDDRPASAEAIGAGLQRDVTGSGSLSSGTALDATRTLGDLTTAPQMARPWSKRGWWVAIPALVVAVVAILYWWSSRDTVPLDGPASSDVLVVAPFTVRGNPDLAYLGEGIVDLMSARLDGIDGMTTVDPRVVLARVREDGIDPAAPQAGAAIARSVGAGRYVTGDVLEVGGRVTLTAALHRVDEGDEPPVKATVEGDAAEVFDLIDALVADLLTHSMSTPGDRLTRTAAMTSGSLEATKEYLRGERLLRAGRYRDAAGAYEAAVALDPTFALAHYRKSVAADWIDAPDARTAAETALKYAGDLPPRERSLLDGLSHRRSGRNREAEQTYRAILHRYPDDVDALIQLGEVLFHDNPRVGRSMSESTDTFARVLALEPTNSNARIHLARLHALHGDLDSLATTAERFAEESAESERALEVEALYAFSLDDDVLQANVVERLATKPAAHVFYAAHGLERFARSVGGAHAILEAAGSEFPLVLSVQAGLYLKQGRFREFETFLAGIPENDSACWDLYRAFVRTSGVVPPDAARMEDLLERLREADPEDILKTSWLPPNEDMTPVFAAFERDYHVAMLLIRLGRIAEARDVMRRMETVEPQPGLGSALGDALFGLQAEIELAAGNDGAALAAIRNVEFEIPHALSVRSFVDGSRARFLRAELERRVGEPQVAKAYYLGLDESWSWWDTPFRPRVYLGLADLAVSDGKTDEAMAYYDRLLELWADSDPVLHPERDEIRAARTALAP
jgi:tetratricopeptide (TPR) repeat protein